LSFSTRAASNIHLPRAARKTVAALPGSGKPPKGFGLSVAFRAQIEHVSPMNLVALKRKTMKTPPGRALEVSAR
jgi:hypothetical protein